MLAADDLVTLLIALVFIGWVVYDWHAVRGEAHERALWIALAGVGISEFVHVSVVYDTIENTLGPGWGTVSFHLGNLIIAMAALDMLHLLQRRTRRTRMVSLVIGLTVVAAAVLPWLVAPPTRVPTALRGHLEFIDSSWDSVIHWGAVMTFLIVVTIASSVNCRRTAAAPDIPRAVRTGMLLISAAGAVMTMVFLAVAAEQIFWFTPERPDVVELDDPLHSLGAGVGLILLGAGASWAKLARARQQRRDRRANTPTSTAARVERLRPHWAELVEAFPGASAFPQALSAPAPDQQALYRQQQRLITEIYDVRWRLSAYVCDQDHQRIADAIAIGGLRGPSAAAAREHAAIQLALRRHRRGAPPLGRAYGLQPRTSGLVESSCQLVDGLRRYQPHRRWVDTVVVALDTYRSDGRAPHSSRS